MSGAVVPIGLEGAKVRLLPGFAWWRATRRGQDRGAELIVFDAARSIRSDDLFAGFWRDDAADMDWLEDFLCDPTMAGMIEVLLEPEEEEEDEIHYNRKDLVQFGIDAMEKY